MLDFCSSLTLKACLSGIASNNNINHYFVIKGIKIAKFLAIFIVILKVKKKIEVIKFKRKNFILKFTCFLIKFIIINQINIIRITLFKSKFIFHLRILIFIFFILFS
jgi:hypothetical protein